MRGWEAIETVYPNTAVQLCIVHRVRHSLNYVGWKQRKAVAADLRAIYTAATVIDAETQLAEFEANRGTDFPVIAQSWQRNQARLIPFFDYPPKIRRIIYTTNAIGSVNISLRRITKNRASFPNDQTLIKLLYLALMNISQKWTMPLQNRKAALNQFTIRFEERMPRR